MRFERQGKMGTRFGSRPRIWTWTSASALLAAGAAVACALPAPASATDVAGAAGAAAPDGGSVSLSVQGAGGAPTELLDRLTIAQLAVVLDVTPAQLLAAVEAREGSAVGPLIGGLLGESGTTLQRLLAGLAEGGHDVASAQQAIDALLAGAIQTPEQLRAAIAQALADLREGGQLTAVAEELGLPRATVESLELAPGTPEEVASTLGATADDLSSLLTSAGAVSQPLTPLLPLVFQALPAGSEGSTTVVGAPAPGGVSLTVVNSTSPASAAPSSSAAASSPSKAASGKFSIVSIKVTRAGTIVETVSVPRPGRVSVSASAVRKLASRSAKTNSARRTRRANVGHAAASGAGGHLRLVIRPHGLGTAKKTSVMLLTTYKPQAGAANTIRRVVSVRRAHR